jgi:hypothetical protein
MNRAADKPQTKTAQLCQSSASVSVNNSVRHSPNPEPASKTDRRLRRFSQKKAANLTQRRRSAEAQTEDESGCSWSGCRCEETLPTKQSQGSVRLLRCFQATSLF